jgi:hypothetical protein
MTKEKLRLKTGLLGSIEKQQSHNHPSHTCLVDHFLYKARLLPLYSREVESNKTEYMDSTP